MKLRELLLMVAAAFVLVSCGQAGVSETEAVDATSMFNTVTATAADIAPSLAPPVTVSLWINPDLPAAFTAQVEIPPRVEVVEMQSDAGLYLDYASQGGGAAWVYALAAPFPTVQDGVSRKGLEAILAGRAIGNISEVTILVSPGTKVMLEKAGFEVSDKTVHVAAEENMLEMAWSAANTWAILPFEELEPRWKVLTVDGVSPFSEDFSMEEYPLAGFIELSGEQWALDAFVSEIILPASNFDPEKMTTLLMTGVTALTRSTAARMDSEGALYPGEDIRDWMTSADLTHISSEVSFDPACPLANFDKHVMHFCSRPEYIELLEDVGVDVVELSGNHLVDWGRPAFEYSLDLYAERGWVVFAGGADLERARRPALVEHNGNRLAFIGCNPAGPEIVWATEDRPGAADCDLDWMEGQVKELRQQGYLPVVTFQYNESYGMVPGAKQKRDFERMSAAGAVIISGSQAHHPQSMMFIDQGFIHFGLGNLFFDQMRIPDGVNVPEVFDPGLPVAGTRLEFLDRHVFYDGRYLGTQLLTALLEDYARPRPLTSEERKVFLERMFEASGWEPY